MSVTIDGSAGVTTNAGGSVNPSTTIDGINYSCRAWVNFNGTGTVAIRASGNVTSITDNGTGDYTVNFTTAMSDANYSVVGGGSRTAVNMLCITARSFATSSVNITPIDTANAKVDSDITTVAIIR
jgi:hypothetical protein